MSLLSNHPYSSNLPSPSSETPSSSPPCPPHTYTAQISYILYLHFPGDHGIGTLSCTSGSPLKVVKKCALWHFCITPRLAPGTCTGRIGTQDFALRNILYIISLEIYLCVLICFSSVSSLVIEDGRSVLPGSSVATFIRDELCHIDLERVMNEDVVSCFEGKSLMLC